MPKRCKHEAGKVEYSFEAKKMKYVREIDMTLIQGPVTLKGICECGHTTNEVMAFGFYGDL